MKFIILALSAATLASALAFGNTDCAATSAIPACAVPCITSAASAIGCTAANDYACQCTSSAALQASAQGCVLKGCGVANAIKAATAAKAVCTSCA